LLPFKGLLKKSIAVGVLLGTKVDAMGDEVDLETWGKDSALGFGALRCFERGRYSSMILEKKFQRQRRLCKALSVSR
jgi:hypothetical protein